MALSILPLQLLTAQTLGYTHLDQGISIHTNGNYKEVPHLKLVTLVLEGVAKWWGHTRLMETTRRC